MHANAASALEEYATPGAKVLDVGCGSGYLSAVSHSLSEILTLGFGSNGSTRR